MSWRISAKAKRGRGEAGITAIHEGITYRFASEANRAVFLGEPARYLPQYGGYCAWAVANGYTAHGDPEQWTVHDGRLYLNYSRAVRWRWERGHSRPCDEWRCQLAEGARRVAEPPKAEVDSGSKPMRRRMSWVMIRSSDSSASEQTCGNISTFSTM